MNGTCNIDLTHNIMTGKPVLDFVDDRVFHRSMIPTELLPPAQHRIRMSQHVCMFYKKHEVLFDQVKIRTTTTSSTFTGIQGTYHTDILPWCFGFNPTYNSL